MAVISPFFSCASSQKFPKYLLRNYPVCNKLDNTNFEEWDKIFAQREQYNKEHPEGKTFRRWKTFKDEDGVVRCTKCGATDDIGGCPECQSEKEFLKGE